MDADAIVVGGGLAGLVATAELADAGRRVLLVEQEPAASLGGQAFWSLGGLFLVNSPEQRRLGITDSVELAWQDWLGAAGFDRAGEDHWGRRWAEAYVDFAAGEKRPWLRAQGVRFFPVVAWAERGGSLATGHGNSVPRFHLAWGTGPALLAPFQRRVLRAVQRGLVRLLFRHRVDELTVTGGAVDGVRGTVLEPSGVARGRPSARTGVGSFEFHAQAVVIASGGIGADHQLVRACWPARLAGPPRRMVSGVPDHVDGRMLAIAEKVGGVAVNRDRMWHYPEGVRHWDPLWTNHGIRILPGPSALWLDARGRRLPVPHFPGFDSLGALEEIGGTGFDHSWLVLTRKILDRELVLSGSDQNPDLTARSVGRVLRRFLPGTITPVRALRWHCPDVVVATSLPALVDGMHAVSGERLVDLEELRRQIVARDREVANPFTKDLQLVAVRGARRYLGDRLVRVAPPHRLLDPGAGPLVAIRLSILTRKTLGGLQTDLSCRVLGEDGHPVPGLYAAGEVAGFGGGGMHGHRSLEGTFLGGCLFTGRQAGRAVAAATA